MSPLSAKFMPDLIAHFAPTLKVTTAPTALDSWTQFSGNISGLGASLTLIVFVIFYQTNTLKEHSLLC